MGENSVSMTKKSSKLSRLASRRTVATATAGLIGAGALLLGGAPAQAADTTATVSGGCLTILACDLKFNAPEFTVPSGGQLTVKNTATGLLSAPVNVTVGGQTKAVPSNKTVTFTFDPSYDQQSYAMSATSTSLLSVKSSSKVTVTPKAKPSNPPSPEPTKPGGGTTTPPGNGGGGGVQAPNLPGGNAPNHGQPPALLPPGVNTPNNQHNQTADPGLPAGVNDGTGTPAQGGAAAGSTQSDPTAVGRPSTDAPGPLTLLVLVASVVIAGVGSAAVRTVLRGRKLARLATH